MKIKDKKTSNIFTVYGIYWQDNKTYFYCFPKNSVGLTSYREDDVEIIDPTIDTDFEYVITYQDTGGIFHRHLLTDKLMDELLEHDPVAYKKFVSLIGNEP